MYRASLRDVSNEDSLPYTVSLGPHRDGRLHVKWTLTSEKGESRLIFHSCLCVGQESILDLYSGICVLVEPVIVFHR